MGDRPPGQELGGDHRVLALERRQLIPADDSPPDLSLQIADGAMRLTLEKNPPSVDDGHSCAELGDVVDDVRREDDDAVLTQFGEQVQEADALCWIETGSGLVDDEEPWIAQHGDGDTEPLTHSTREATELLLPHVPEIRLAEKRLDHIPPLPSPCNPAEDGKVIQQPLRRGLRIDAELLRQVAQCLAHLVFLPQDIERPEMDLPLVGLLEGGDRAHERRLAGAIRAEKSVHAGWNGQMDALQRMDAIRIGFRQIADTEVWQWVLLPTIVTSVGAGGIQRRKRNSFIIAPAHPCARVHVIVVSSAIVSAGNKLTRYSAMNCVSGQNGVRKSSLTVSVPRDRTMITRRKAMTANPRLSKSSRADSPAIAPNCRMGVLAEYRTACSP